MNQSPSHSQQIPGFQLLARIGAGGMGAVYKAKQLSLDRVVAIKVLPREFSRDQKNVARFYAEGRSAARLNHPNIVGALDVGQAGEYHYFVMEFIAGHSVYDELQENVRYEEEDAVKIVRAVAQGLEHAHKAGLIHRDVKPHNIMIGKDGVAKLVDMGLALDTGGDEAKQLKAGEAHGSPYYIAPEQILSKPDIDFRADIYGLGATFYYMLTGQVPFDAPEPVDVFKLHLRKPLKDPRKINARISEGASQVIRVCMAKKRSSRYDNTSDLVADLQALELGEPPMHAQAKLGELGVDTETEAEPEEKLGPVDKFARDLSASSMDKSADKSVDKSIDRSVTGSGSSAAALLQQPLFWLAVGGWLAAALFFILWMTKS